MICTSKHNEFLNKNYDTYAISGNRGKDANYEGKCYPKLAPKLSFWEIWHDNIGTIPEEENNKYYIREYYKQVLSKLDPNQVYKELDNSILLCYEKNEEFCHRHIVSAWFEILLGTEVPEVKINKGKIEIVDKPLYIKKYLEDIIKKDMKIENFTKEKVRRK